MKILNYEFTIRRVRKWELNETCKRRKSKFIKWLWKNADWKKLNKLTLDVTKNEIEIIEYLVK